MGLLLKLLILFLVWFPERAATVHRVYDLKTTLLVGLYLLVFEDDLLFTQTALHEVLASTTTFLDGDFGISGHFSPKPFRLFRCPAENVFCGQITPALCRV